jgi:hypothetical protein
MESTKTTCTEMEFLNGISMSKCLGINSSFLRLEFLSGFLPHFSVLQNAIREKIRVFLFHRFFVRIFKTREENGFFLNPPVEGTLNSKEQKTRVFC